MADPEAQGREPNPRAWRLSLLVALLLTVLSAVVRVETAFADPLFDREQAAGLLKSDPALLHYITARLVDAGGTPDDFGADPRIQHPDATDVPGEFTVGQERLIAATYRWFGVEGPLHVWALRVMALTASLIVLAAWGLAREVSGSARAAALAALLVALVPANYRTLGFVYLREDLSFPLFALHLWALASAIRLRTLVAGLLAGLLLICAIGLWHAMGFFALIEAAALLLVLRPRRRALFVVGAGALLLLVWWALGGAADRASHVLAVASAKLRHLGRLPADPAAVPFDARLLWQGPFATLDLAVGARLLGVAVLGLPALAWRGRRRASREPLAAPLLGITALALPAAWMFERTLILPALLLPIVLVACVDRRLGPRVGARVLAGLLVVQGLLFGGFLHGHTLDWYGPPSRAGEERELFAWIEAELPPGEPLLVDFVTGPAVLAFTGRPICLQPKYETDLARRKIEDFLTAFHRGTVAELAKLMRERFQVRFLIVDVDVLWMEETTWTAGLPRGTLRTQPGSAAEALLGSDPGRGPGSDGASLGELRLRWASPPARRWWSKAPISRFSVYELAE